MLEAAPYQVHTIHPDNSIQFAEQPRNRNTIYSKSMRLDMVCKADGIEHRLNKAQPPWSSEDREKVRGTVFPTNGQVKRINRTIKEGVAGQNMILGSHSR